MKENVIFLQTTENLLMLQFLDVYPVSPLGWKTGLLFALYSMEAHAALRLTPCAFI